MKSATTSLARQRIVLFVLSLFFSQWAFAQVTVTGRITNELNVPLGGFGVLATGTETKVVYTNSNGDYTFSLQQGGSYEIKPLGCQDNALNGLTTFDVVLITKHFGGIQPLDSPYKIIAADLDNNGELGTSDTVTLRSIILGITTQLPAGNWRFVPKSYIFPNPLDPFTPAYPQSISIANLQPQSIPDGDFIAVKVGDVNNSAVAATGCNDPQLPAVISGKVFRDQTPNCQLDTGETGLAGWTVTATDGTNSFYGSSNSSGGYTIFLLPGTYDIIVNKPNDLWGGCTDTVQNVVVTIANGGLVDFPQQPEVLCPAMDVDLSSAFLRRCFSNRYVVRYCNWGTETANNAHVELELDPFFEFSSSTVPGTLISGNTYSFDLGDIPSGVCGQFRVSFVLNCDATLGQTHCSEASIYPNVMCGTGGAWTGADLRVSGICTGDEVQFTVTNHGGDMVAPSNYIVIEDIVVMMPPMQNPFTLAGGASEVITLPANGTTKRMEVEQPAGHPWSDKASATVEGCGTNAGGGFSTGMVNLFPQSDQSPIVDIDCRENTGSFDPNDKQGIPFGVLAEHYIPLQQPIEYLIRFQNTGTDTAFTVIIRDTLHAALDATSIRPLGSSHPYSFNLSGEGVAQFVFSNIMLPDSNVNEAASHGYVKFVIEPKPDTAEGVVTKNSAAIYFDFNEPVITNTTWHTLGSKFLVGASVVFNPSIALDVFPNPTADKLNFLIKSASPLSGILQLFDVAGKQVAFEKFAHNAFTFDANGLKSGHYTYKISTPTGALATGKVVVVR
jgi:Secretion system C-terminal sorting domain